MLCSVVKLFPCIAGATWPTCQHAGVGSVVRRDADCCRSLYHARLAKLDRVVHTQALAGPLVNALGRAVLTGQTPVVAAALPLLADACQFQQHQVRVEMERKVHVVHRWAAMQHGVVFEVRQCP